ncbi:MAG: HAMP domain-containing histidine kinase [Phycisphaerales bacterium]|nr:MAG: HAMP domain-containing histidine kinase [Phycisphaerales bacterium]
MNQPPPTHSDDVHSLGRLSQVEEELNGLRAELERAHRLATLGVLAAGVAHEINNVLTPVLGYTQLTQAHPDDADLQAKAADRIVGGIEAAVRIARAMLDFSTKSDEPQCANISQVLQSTLDCVARDPAKDGISLTRHIPPAAKVRIRPVALQQVLLNLLINAIRAMRDQSSRGGSLGITAVEQADGTTLITVSDTGPGIPEEIADRLFEPFVSSASSHTYSQPSKGGSGLGLAVCKRLIEAAGGLISATSTPGQGTTFTISLPTDQSQQQAKAG